MLSFLSNLIYCCSCFISRRKWDSNPRYPFEVYALSRRAPSTTRPSLRFRIAGFLHFLAKQGAIYEFFLNLQHYFEISPLNEWLKSAIISSLFLYFPNKNNSFVTAASVVLSWPLSTPIFFNRIPVSYFSISTVPA